MTDAPLNFDAPAFVAWFVASMPNIAAIKLFQPIASLPIQDDRSLTTAELSLVKEALQLRDHLKLPFWECVLLQASHHSVAIPNILRLACRHNRQDDSAVFVRREECTESHLRGLTADTPPTKMLAISSKVSTTDSSTLHIPMLDFHCEASRANLELAKGVIGQLGQKGFIAESGRSYHFYGRQLVETSELIFLLSKALLFAPIADRAWIGHQLIEQASGLRISKGKGYKVYPNVVAVI